MEVYIYCADIYCEECGRAIRERLDSENEHNRADYEKQYGTPYDPPNADTPENEYDSDEYPKGPYGDGGGESDCPQHCACGTDCLNAMELPSGHKIGAWLENPLTSQGVRYVAEHVHGNANEVTDLWAQWYSEELANL